MSFPEHLLERVLPFFLEVRYLFARDKSTPVLHSDDSVAVEYSLDTLACGERPILTLSRVFLVFSGHSNIDCGPDCCVCTASCLSRSIIVLVEALVLSSLFE
mgnify:CR=1 FL=1